MLSSSKHWYGDDPVFGWGPPKVRPDQLKAGWCGSVGQSCRVHERVLRREDMLALLRAITKIIYYLGKHPEDRQELFASLGAKEKDPSPETIKTGRF
jgi:hypothetical protein